MKTIAFITSALALTITGSLFAAVPYAKSDEYYATSFEYAPITSEPIGPYWECTFKRPAYIEPVEIDGNRAAKCWWSAADYDGTRLDRGMEACSGNSTTELRFLEDGWYGLRIRVPSGDYPTDKNTIILQLFAHGRGGSWTGTLHLENNKLSIVHRSWLTTNHTVYELDADIPRDTWIPIIIYWKPSTNSAIGKIKVWYDGAPKGSPSYDYTGKVGFDAIDDGNGGWLDGWVDEDTMISGIGLKWGMYCADAVNYSLNETRTLYYDDVSQLKGNPVGAWDLVNPEADGRNAFGRIDAEYYSEQSGTVTETCTDADGGLNLSYLQNGDWVAYYDVNFGTGAELFEARVASATSGGTIEVRLDSINGSLLGSCAVENTGGWQKWVNKTVSISPVSGLRRIYLKFTGGSGNLFNLNSFKFTENADTGVKEKFPVSAGNVTASAHQDPNVPANTIDGDIATRWSAMGDGQWIRYDLGAEKNVQFLNIAWLNGSSRVASFHVEASKDGATWTSITSGNVQTSGTTSALEGVDVTDMLARYVRIVGHGSTANSWNSITEVEIWGTTGLPAVPADLTATSGDGQVALGWTASPGATLHHLKRSIESGGPFETIASAPGAAYLDTGVVNGTVYHYVVSAVAEAGESADSPATTAKPYAPISPEELYAPGASRSGDGMELSIETVNGRVYQWERSDTLAPEDWEKIGSPITGTGEEITLSDPDGAGVPKRFYRLLIEP